MKLSIGKVRGTLYTVAKLLGDVNAVQGGPDKVFKRILRKQAGKTTARGMNSAFQKLLK